MSSEPHRKEQIAVPKSDATATNLPSSNTFGNIIAPSILLVFCGVIHHLVAVNVKDPFIDEKFHLRQCNVYCNYRFSEWDDKITTPPGLYLLGFVYAQVISLFTKIPVNKLCENFDILRSVNIVGGIVVFPLILSAFRNLKNDQFWTVNVVSLPLIFPYYFLFYTDVWASILLVAAFAFAYTEPNSQLNVWLSGIIGFVSLWFRQTNIVWLAFIASVMIERRATHSTSVWQRVQNYVTEAMKSIHLLIPSMVNFLLFGLFVKLNGGITFGDKENHELNLHVVQVFYAVSFITILTFPVWFSTNKLKRYLKFAIYGHRGLNVIFFIAASMAINYIIKEFTVVHPFLLADNRHYTFYIYRRVLSHKYLSHAMTPVYHFSSWCMIDALLTNKNTMRLSPITAMSFFIAICLTIIPSPLFEPRYYIVPLIFFRLFIAPTNHKGHILEFLWVTVINVIFMIVFMKYEFRWDSEVGIQRIIW